MATAPAKPQGRIDLVDALRGSALAAILLLHSIEHFDFLRYPPFPSPWMRKIDGWAFDTAFFLFGGKAYAIFAMMFGLSFFLILDRAAQRGVNFRWRFLWRLAVLGLIGYVHGIVYCGDILTILAVLGIPLVVFYGFSSRVLGWLSVAFLLQLPLLYQLASARWLPHYTAPGGHSWPYYRALSKVFAEGGFWDVCRVNLVKGELAKWWWTIDNGRYLQMFGLFIWGLLLGRMRVFEHRESSIRLAWRALLTGAIAFPIIWAVGARAKSVLPKGPMADVVRKLTDSYGDLVQMLVWVGAFVLLYECTRGSKVLKLLAPYGRMSLTCYVTQALVWVPVYYNFGLGLFRLMGPAVSVAAGACFFLVQLALAHAWMRRFHYGPLEWLWRCGTLLTWKVPLRRKPFLVAVPETQPAP